jgi:pyruvate dehydrogenase E1 component alpha subunit
MLRSRLVEEAITELWHAGLVSGEMHLGIGEEGIVAGTVGQLRTGDAMALDHRSTAPMVMRGVDIGAIIKECLGRSDGLCKGVGGHMHLYSKDHLAASSGIVGSSGPAACGFALAHQHLRPGNVAIAFFGEGAMNQGMLMESMNLAVCWSLPVLFVCKDNGMAITTASNRVTGGDLCERARSFGLMTAQVDGADVEAVWNAARNLIESARDGEGPGFLHATCSRPDGHFLGDPLLRIVRRPVAEISERVIPLVSATTQLKGGSVTSRAAGVGDIVSTLGRAAKMLASPGRDPVNRLRKRLDEDENVISGIEEEVRHEIEAAVATVHRSEEVGA